MRRRKFYFGRVKHSGKACDCGAQAHRLVGAAALVLLAVAYLATVIGTFVLGMAGVLAALWVLFVGFTFYFFRDPDPVVPGGAEPRRRPRPRQGGRD